MNLADHIKLLKQYEDARMELLEQVKSRIDELGTVKAGKMSGLPKQVTSNIKHDRRPISYYKLIQLAKCLGIS